MCSRFVLNHSSLLLQQWYEAACIPEFEPRFNIAPGNAIPTVHQDAIGYAIKIMRWGFIPAWVDNPAVAPMLHNARGETVAEKPMFRQSFSTRRCIIPASGYYEWKVGAGKKSRQPFYLSLRDGTPLSFAGIWESTVTSTGHVLDTCTIVTTKANSLVEPIHHRMPVLLAKEDWQAWLGIGATVSDLMPLLRPYPAEEMQAWEVDSAVDLALNDGPGLLQPLAGNIDSAGNTGNHPALL